ncbi:dienelactone hydrolase family protein [Nodosilinea sp. LEGE 07088]|uniref:dienelactone hydrolase family protein n=1 Tax=Nodosilinea sp. LEGE 07088 TaxID=2777968 RepID=UPI0028BE37E5|nr:dienelactone hydrolase family protein [Nodosilinea sp. LEGE 07088]
MRKVLLVMLAAVITTLVAMGLSPEVQANIVAEPVVYTIDGQPFEGYLAVNDNFGGDRPLVLVVHDWNGLDNYEQRRAQMLAEQGYAAFAVDLYGQGVRPSNTDESRVESGKLYADRATMRARLMAGLDQAQTMAGVDGNRVVAIGYCFGGAAVLEMARAGMGVDGFVVFHGSLSTPEGQDYSKTPGRILVLHGSADSPVPMADVAQLAAELDAAKVDFDMEIYGGADHAYTVWSGDRYNGPADRRSWRTMMNFLDETLR